MYGATVRSTLPPFWRRHSRALRNERLLKLGLVFIVVAVKVQTGRGAVSYVGARRTTARRYPLPPLSVRRQNCRRRLCFRILVTGLGTVHHDWSQMFAVLAVASLLIGNLAAIMQANIKRMLAYSTIAYGLYPLAFMAGGGRFRGGFVLRHYFTR